MPRHSGDALRRTGDGDGAADGARQPFKAAGGDGHDHDDAVTVSGDSAESESGGADDQLSVATAMDPAAPIDFSGSLA